MVLIMYNNQLYIHETNLNNKLSISKDSNDEKLAGVATLESIVSQRSSLELAS